MMKERTTLIIQIKNLLTRYTWLKIVSLVLAVMTWLYVRGKIPR